MTTSPGQLSSRHLLQLGVYPTHCLLPVLQGYVRVDALVSQIRYVGLEVTLWLLHMIEGRGYFLAVVHPAVPVEAVES